MTPAIVATITVTRGTHGARCYNGHSTRELARALDCDPAHVSRILHGAKCGSFGIMERLSRLLGVGLDELIVWRHTQGAAITVKGAKQ